MAAVAALALGAPCALASAGAAAAAPAGHHPSTASPTKIAAAVVTLLNKERAAHGLHTLTVDKRLVVAARRHSTKMAAENQFSHQVGGEAALPIRVSRAGYTWSGLAENLGHGKHLTRKGALHIVRVWYAERPPNDPHRVNSLAPQYRNIGVAIVLDKKHHALWMTADFGRH